MATKCEDTRGFRPISGHPGFEVNRKGEVLRTSTGNLLTTQLFEGYKRVSYRYLAADGKRRGRTILIHRALLSAFDREPEPGEVCRHLDGDSTNNKLTNLQWGSMKENAADSLRHGTFGGRDGQHWAKGPSKGKRPMGGPAKLIPDQVREIRTRWGTATEMARFYGVGRAAIHHILAGRTWGWLPGEATKAEGEIISIANALKKRRKPSGATPKSELTQNIKEAVVISIERGNNAKENQESNTKDQGDQRGKPRNRASAQRGRGKRDNPGRD